ncbi:MAG: 30S ribosomal protein S27e [Nanoarchaeota archaeon]|nr:30S ribosomal protein S27e [Nanoarchaeota archaeon]
MKNKFLRVRCECKNEQIVFERASTNVNCLVCNKQLTKSTGGKAKIEGRVLEALE